MLFGMLLYLKSVEGYTRELSILDIQDISYSFEKRYKPKISQLKIIDSFSAF